MKNSPPRLPSCSANIERQYSYVRPSISFSSPCSIIWIFVKRSTTSPNLRLSNLGRAKFLGNISFRRLFSFSIARIALSITVPISGVCACRAISLHLASAGTKKIPSDVYSSISSSNPSPSASNALYFSSNRLEIYFKKIRPNTTLLYSDASRFPINTHAAFQICFSNPISAVFLSAILSASPSFYSLKKLC